MDFHDNSFSFSSETYVCIDNRNSKQQTDIYIKLGKFDFMSALPNFKNTLFFYTLIKYREDGKLLLCSSLFIQHKFRVCALFAVGTYQDKLHIGKDAKAPLSAKLRFELVS